MGGGNWSASTYDAVTKAKVNNGTAFNWDRTARATGNYAAHPTLDPTNTNKAGLNIRESLDTPEHPNTKPMVVGFDVTGSMGSIPRNMQDRLKTLFGLTIDKGITDVQIAIAAYGDATCDDVPLQVGQFESGNQVDDELDNIFVEGNGGGNGGETSNLLMYYLAHHTHLDSYTKRGEKGHLYLIGDEVQLPITPAHVRKYIGDGEPLGDLSFAGIATDLTRTFDVTILLINNWTSIDQKSHEFYTNLFGPDAIVPVEDPNTIPEMIAGLFAYDLGRSIDDITSDLTATVGREIAVRVGNTLTKRQGSGRVALR